MVQLFLLGFGKTITISTSNSSSISSFYTEVSKLFIIPRSCFFLTTLGNKCINSGFVSDHFGDGSTVQIQLRINGGIDFQHREGSKIGSGGQLSEAQAAIERRERLRKLALETIDITKDPYIMKNHLGSFECKLCLTLHNNEGNYLAHTQGKRHQVRGYSIFEVERSNILTVQSRKKSCHGSS